MKGSLTEPRIDVTFDLLAGRVKLVEAAHYCSWPGTDTLNLLEFVRQTLEPRMVNRRRGVHSSAFEPLEPIVSLLDGIRRIPYFYAPDRLKVSVDLTTYTWYAGGREFTTMYDALRFAAYVERCGGQENFDYLEQWRQRPDIKEAFEAMGKRISDTIDAAVIAEMLARV